MRRSFQRNQDPKNGQFLPGNKAAEGVRDQTKGRKPKFVKQALYDLLFLPPDEKSISLVEKARQTLVDALDAKGDDGKPSAAAVAAARDIWDRAFGRARQTMDLRVSNTEQLIEDLTPEDVDAEIESLNSRVGHNGTP